MKRILLIISIALLLLATSFTGCISPEDSSDDSTADEILANMLRAIESVSSYKYSAEVKSTRQMINESETNTTEIVAIQNGEVDIANKKLKQDNTGTTTEASGEQHWIVYIVDGIQYSGTEENGIIRWSSHNTSISSPNSANMTWNAYSVLEGQKLTFESEYIEWFDNFTLERLPDERVEGVNCYALRVTTTYENQSYGMYYPYLGNTSQESEVKYWIAKNTDFLIKLESKSTQESSGWRAFRWPEVDREITVSEMNIVFYDYNKPVTIEVPPEAMRE